MFVYFAYEENDAKTKRNHALKSEKAQGTKFCVGFISSFNTIVIMISLTE
jgi:hypothetical protein